MNPELESLTRDLELHRQNKVRGKRKIPDEIWQRAYDLDSKVPSLHVMTKLRLNSLSWRRRFGDKKKKVKSVEIVPVDLFKTNMASLPKCAMELELPFGIKLKVWQ